MLLASCVQKLSSPNKNLGLTPLWKVQKLERKMDEWISASAIFRNKLEMEDLYYWQVVRNERACGLI